MEVAGLVAKIIREEKPVKVNIDVGGLGVGVADRLEEQGYGEIINRVNFGGKPIEPDSRRSEMSDDNSGLNLAIESNASLCGSAHDFRSSPGNGHRHGAGVRRGEV